MRARLLSYLVLVALTGSFACLAEETSPADASASSPRRRVVLGFALEPTAADADVWRLVETDSDGTRHVLDEGPLATCEQQLVARLQAQHGRGRLNVPLATLGGMQLWGDVYWHAGWRIQQHVSTGHHRLLDPDDVRRTWGSFEACRTDFEARRVAGEVASAPDHVVIVLHGLFRTRHSFTRMLSALHEDDYGVAHVSYPSTRRSLAQHADQIERLLERLDARRVSFVTHSLGGLVVRALLAREAPWRKRIELGGVVMIAPPSQGSDLAGAVRDSLPFTLLADPIGDDLLSAAAATLPAPTCHFGVIAGGKGDGEGYNPLLEGDDDGVVRVAEALLLGADDVLVVRCLHTFLMNEPQAVEATRQFLQTGRFAAGTSEG